MASVTTDLKSAPELFGPESSREVSVSQRAGKHSSPIIGSVTSLTLGLSSIFRRSAMGTDPAIPHRVHSMRTAGDRSWLPAVAAAAFCHHTSVPLQTKALDIVIPVKRGVFRVGGAVAGFALQTSMPGGKTVEIQSQPGGVGIGGKSGIQRDSEAASFQRGGVTDLAIILHRRPGVAVLTGRLFQPAPAARKPNGHHRTVAILALHGQRPILCHCATHRPAQTASYGTGMTSVTGSPVGTAVKGCSGKRIDSPGVKSVDRLSQSRDSRDSRPGEGIGSVTAVA